MTEINYWKREEKGTRSSPMATEHKVLKKKYSNSTSTYDACYKRLIEENVDF